MIVAVHDVMASWEELRDAILLPPTQQGIAGGFTTPPRETTFEIDNMTP